ncbi:transglutaminase domain-containing protein [bacterium]|nr:transglutaminase domain-containing protein [bacterium]
MRKKASHNLLLFPLLCITFLLIASSAKYPYSKEIIDTLKKAGKNKSELIKVLEHYNAYPEKSKAAHYLIENMAGHCYAPFQLLDEKKNKVCFNILDYPDYNALKEALNEIEKEKGELRFKVEKLIYDAKVIKAEFLIKQIDHALRAWKERPWAKQYSFEVFCDYILPYRGSNEPLENWREPLFNKYKNIAKDMKDPADPTEAAVIINNDIRSWFKFDSRFYVHPTDQGYAEMLETEMGRCEDMTNLTIYALRANGIAVTSDYTPHWANSGNNHAWNAIVLPGGKAVPFMGAEANPGKYRLSNKVAKAYRKMFRKIKDNLYFLKKKQKHIPPWLGGKSYLDVTKDYSDVCDVSYHFTGKLRKKYDIAFLTVFNSGKWKAMQWGKIVNNEAVFADMGNDEILYLPALYIKKEIIGRGNPFVLHNDGTRTSIDLDKNTTITVKLLSTTRRKELLSTDGIVSSCLKDDTEYELFYWEDEWISFGKKTAVKEEVMVFDNLPTHGLYWLVEVEGNKEERPFTYENDMQIFW